MNTIRKLYHSCEERRNGDFPSAESEGLDIEEGSGTRATDTLDDS